MDAVTFCIAWAAQDQQSQQSASMPSWQRLLLQNLRSLLVWSSQSESFDLDLSEPHSDVCECENFLRLVQVAVGFRAQVNCAFHMSSTLSVFLKPLTEELAVSRGLFSLLRSVILLAGGLAPLSAWTSAIRAWWCKCSRWQAWRWDHQHTAAWVLPRVFLYGIRSGWELRCRRSNSRQLKRRNQQGSC